MVRKLTLLFLGLLIFSTLLLIGWYRVDGIPSAESADFLSGAGFTVTEDDRGALTFAPENGNGFGIVIMHGALILPQSYARSAAYFASRGYTVHLPRGFARLSIAAIDQAIDSMRALDVEGWFFIGHSMGGLASLETVSRREFPVKGVALWATAMPKDFTQVAAPILFIWGDTDGLLPAERFELSKGNLPADTRYIILAGANHKNFAMYTHQFFDREAEIDWMEQINFANETTARFFAELH